MKRSRINFTEKEVMLELFRIKWVNQACFWNFRRRK